LSLRVFNISNEIAANALNTKRPENKNFWQKTQKTETLAFYIQSIYTIKTLQHWLIRIIYSKGIQVMVIAEKPSILSKQSSYDPPRRLKRSIHMDLQPHAPWGKLSDMEL
jgi:hypothetical protein